MAFSSKEFYDDVKSFYDRFGHTMFTLGRDPSARALQKRSEEFQRLFAAGDVEQEDFILLSNIGYSFIPIKEIRPTWGGADRLLLRELSHICREAAGSPNATLPAALQYLSRPPDRGPCSTHWILEPLDATAIRSSLLEYVKEKVLVSGGKRRARSFLLNLSDLCNYAYARGCYAGIRAQGAVGGWTTQLLAARRGQANRDIGPTVISLLDSIHFDWDAQDSQFRDYLALYQKWLDPIIVKGRGAYPYTTVNGAQEIVPSMQVLNLD